MDPEAPTFTVRRLDRTGQVAYQHGLELQEKLIPEAMQDRECLLLLEHEPVYTIGRTRDQSSLGSDPISNLPHPVFETNRGGQATYHGPGQLVGYPILNLAKRGKDLHRYLRFLESVLIACCAKFGVTADRKPGLTGVWVEDRKIASLGVGVKKWVSMHGFALNVCNELTEFSHITPCGISGVTMTSLSVECGHHISVGEVGDLIESIFPNRLHELMDATKF